MNLAGLIEDVALQGNLFLPLPVIFLLLGAFDFALAGQSSNLSAPSSLSLPLVYLGLFVIRLTSIACSAFAVPQSVFLFTAGIPIGYLHSPTESRGLSSAELHVQLPVSDSGLEGADRLVLGDILHCVV